MWRDGERIRDDLMADVARVAKWEMAGDGQLVRLVSQITFNGLPPTIHYFLFAPWSWMPISMDICRDSLDGCGAIGHSRYK